MFGIGDFVVFLFQHFMLIVFNPVSKTFKRFQHHQHDHGKDHRENCDSRRKL